MYPLLPLQIFKLRHEMESIKRSRGTNTQELNELILNAMETAQTVANKSKALYEEEKINGEDLHKILLAVSNLFEYLNNTRIKKENYALNLLNKQIVLIL